MTTARAASAVFDVAVAGAGPAGSATARWLALRGATVALIECTDFAEPRIGESLAPAVQPWIAKLGLWREFVDLGPLRSFGTRSCWGEESLSVHSHLMSPWGCGWHVDRRALDRMFAEGACRAGAMAFSRTTVVACDPEPSGWRLALREGGGRSEAASRTVSARVLIDATGRAARCASRLGARRLLLDRLVAIAVRFEGVAVERECNVLVEASPDGWWYSAPVPGGGMVAMLMTDSDLCRRQRAASVEPWESLLAAAPLTSARVHGARRVTAPVVYSAASQRLCRPHCRQPWIAVGDAALAVDPISGSGVIRALQTAWSGAETAYALLGEGSGDAIARYEARRDLECTRYLEERALYYGQESRWPRASFWARRGAGREALRYNGAHEGPIVPDPPCPLALA